MLNENKLSKYLLYAIGEIVLVVIGILIALWLNNLNTISQNKEKGDIMLLEIRENLISDTLLIHEISTFNAEKSSDISKFMQIAAQKKVSPELGEKMFFLLSEGKLFTNASFTPNSTGYKTLTNSGNIEIIANTELRNQLTQYYLKTSIAAFDELLNLTRSFKYYILPKIMNREFVKKVTNLDFQIRNLEDIKLNEDEKMVSDLILILANINQNEQASVELKKELAHLIALIDEELKK
ncbi:hypothetical protein SAMN04489796_1043 [Winogradskyella thalassocola]|uniref:Uncharacterized protein n=2 Tax=Winogradskyella thalassocola TaxID=262004 RepID=A0A1G8EQ19_9FLAO|nr:hypothetical protein SAMN04489796_1043 [Winogradskyella thalassocola]